MKLLILINFEISEIFKKTNDLFAILNKGLLLFFFCLKFIFVFILLMVGILTLTKLRGIYLAERLKNIDESENQLKKPRLIVGTIYIFLAIGIAFNFLIYLLIWISYFLPPPLIFQILDVIEPGFYDLDRIKDPNKSKYEYDILKNDSKKLLERSKEIAYIINPKLTKLTHDKIYYLLLDYNFDTRFEKTIYIYLKEGGIS